MFLDEIGGFQKKIRHDMSLVWEPAGLRWFYRDLMTAVSLTSYLDENQVYN